jgi:hypothetical protein
VYGNLRQISEISVGSGVLMMTLMMMRYRRGDVCDTVGGIYDDDPKVAVQTVKVD